MSVALVRRVLSCLKPHRGTFLAAALASTAFAALDAFSFVLLIPFLGTVFGSIPEAGSGGPEAGPGSPEAGSASPEAGPESVAGGGSESTAGGGSLAGEPDAIRRAMDATVGRFVDLDGGDPLAAVTGIIVFIVAVVACKNVVDFLRAYLTAKVEQGVTRDLRNRVYGHLLELNLSFFGRTKTGQIVSRLTHDVEQLRTLVTKELVATVSAVWMFVAALYWMIQISARLTVAAFVVVPLTMVIWGPLVRRLKRDDRRVLETAGEVGAHVQETVSGIRLVKTATAEAAERKRFQGLTGDYFSTFMRTVRLRALAAPLTEFLVTVGTAVLLWYGARMVVSEEVLTGAAFVGFIALSSRLYAPVKYLSKLPVLIQPGLVAAERVFEFLDAPTETDAAAEADAATETAAPTGTGAPAEPANRNGVRPFASVGEGIRYRRVCLEYRQGEPVLREVSFHVPPGTTVAFVGPSGGGKTSIVDLLGRFYDPTSGAVEIDGVDVREYSLASLRRGLGIVSQETVLFHDTVRANIAYGTEGAGDEQVREAARAAHAHDFIAQLPSGYDTLVGERGTALSGGQRQRIAIARAVLRDPPVLVLDEATSALDAESERLVQKAVKRLLVGRTVFVIAHRLSTIRQADLILVVEQGRVVQRGDHDSLAGEGGLYRRLRDLQFR